MVRGVKKSGLGGLVLMLAMTSLAGCGSDDSGPEVSEFAEFLGVWEFTQSAVTEMCTGQPAEQLTVTGAKQFMYPGATTDLAAPDLFVEGCNLKFTVDKKVATMTTDVKCPVGDGVTDFYQPTSGTFTLLAATKAEEKVVMNGKISFMSGATVVQLDCMLTIEGTLDKIANF